MLASTDSYRHQGFRRGNHLLALQFHAEMGVDPRIDEWITESGESLDRLGISGNELRDYYAAYGPGAVAAGQRMIADWIAGLDPALDANPVAQADAISLFGQM